MKIGGFQKNSLIDYPGLISSVIFTSGCNLSCPFCHNSSLVNQKNLTELKESEILSFLQKRKGKLDAVTISGGEPTLQENLQEFIQNIKSMGYKVKLDTNGTNPKLLKALINENLIDYIAMDIKSTLDYSKYNFICGSTLNKKTFNNILKSIKIIINSKVNHEFRTTAIRGIHHSYDINTILNQIEGADKYVIQNFNPKTTLDPQWNLNKPISQQEMLSQITKENQNKVGIIEMR